MRFGDSDDIKTRLVYRVNELPGSMIPFIWDYKSLNVEEEEKYISKMIQKTYNNSTIIGREINMIKIWVMKDEAEKKKLEAFN